MARKLVEIPRDYLILMMEIGYVLLAMQRFEEAFEVFEGVHHLAPNSDVPRIAMGNTYSAQEKFDEAIREYKKALKIVSDSALAHAHLGEAYLMKNDKTKANDFIQKAMDLDPNGKSGAFARQLMDAMEKGLLPISEEMKKDLIETAALLEK